MLQHNVVQHGIVCVEVSTNVVEGVALHHAMGDLGQSPAVCNRCRRRSGSLSIKRQWYHAESTKVNHSHRQQQATTHRLAT